MKQNGFQQLISKRNAAKNLEITAMFLYWIKTQIAVEIAGKNFFFEKLHFFCFPWTYFEKLFIVKKQSSIQSTRAERCSLPSNKQS